MIRRRAEVNKMRGRYLSSYDAILENNELFLFKVASQQTKMNVRQTTAVTTHPRIPAPNARTQLFPQTLSNRLAFR